MENLKHGHIKILGHHLLIGCALFIFFLSESRSKMPCGFILSHSGRFIIPCRTSYQGGLKPSQISDFEAITRLKIKV